LVFDGPKKPKEEFALRKLARENAAKPAEVKAARGRLVESGLKEEAVKEMLPSQVILLDAMLEYEARLDARARWRQEPRREQKIGRTSDFKNGDRRIVFLGETEIGVFKDNEEFFAYSNTCLHQGGPACEGLIIAKVEERIMPDKTSRGLFFSDTELHFVCPWHGYEYDLKTGECVADRRLKLRRYEVVQKGDDLYVRG